MEKINKKIIMDFIISILIVIAIALILSVIFYNRTALTKIIPESEEYQLTEEMQEDLEDGIIEESKEIVTSYYIDAADLKKYEATKEYNKGKINPFAAESNQEMQNTIISNEINMGITGTTSQNTNKYFEDEGIK